MDYPQIDPVAFSIGPLDIRWYALAYITGILLAWWLIGRLIKRVPVFMTRKDLDDYVVYGTLGVILGGRLGYVLFYKPGYFIGHPLEAFALWQGGMSFHGGMLGVILATIIFARIRKIPLLCLGDVVAVATPIGLFFGRIANFINGELWGRPSDVPWAMVFPSGGPVPRHPSQLYEAFLEGIVLFAVLFALERLGARRRPGQLVGVFLIGYGLARTIVEFFREPDAHLGFLIGGATMGQLLSLPMILAGIAFIAYARRRPAVPDRVGDRVPAQS